MRVLAVDDAPSIRTLFECLLNAAGCEVVTAGCARDALRALRSFQPDVVLTDYNMPGIDGRGLISLLRRKAGFETTPIFVVSSEECPLIHQAVQRAGADGWFAKPINPAILLAAMRRHVEDDAAGLTARRRASGARAFARVG